MAEPKQPRKRSTTATKRAKSSKTEAKSAETPVSELPPTETPAEVSTKTPAEVSPVEALHADATPVEETPSAEAPAAEPVAGEASAEELRKAQELLEANGYLTVGYREHGKKVRQAVDAGIDFVKGKWKSFGGWLSAKRDAMNARHEERVRAAAEKKRLDDEAAARRAEIVRNELRLAELRVEEARLKAAAEGAKSGTPLVRESTAPAPSPVPVTESAPHPVSTSEGPKCAVCGAELVPGARFCRKCGNPISEVAAATEAAALDSTPKPEGSKCAVCGAELVPGARFCRNCGNPIPEVAASSSKDAPAPGQSSR